MKIRFLDHGSFHLDVFWVSLGGLMGAAAANIVEVVLPVLSPGIFTFLGLFMGGTIILSRRVPWAEGALAAAVGGVAGSVVDLTPSFHPFSAILMGATLGVLLASPGSTLRRRIEVAGAVGLCTLAAAFVMSTMGAHAFLELFMPSPLAHILYGGMFGLVAGTGALSKQVALDKDRVAREFDAIEGILQGELRAFASHAQSLFRKIEASMGAQNGHGQAKEVIRAVEEVVIRVFKLCRRWTDVEAEVGDTDPEVLSRRISDMEAKIAASSDAMAKHQYTLAAESLRAQLRYVGEIERGRERVMARLHHQVAALEKTRLALASLRSSSAQQASDEIQPMLDNLNGLAAEVDDACEAVNEILTMEIKG